MEKMQAIIDERNKLRSDLEATQASLELEERDHRADVECLNICRRERYTLLKQVEKLTAQVDQG